MQITTLISQLLPAYVNTVLNNELNDLEHQRISIEERRRTLKKLEKEELREQ